jgi:2-polyprenyl-6-methoxyphenol hydroxylase-like FAD-dependent oxidoreductase
VTLLGDAAHPMTPNFGQGGAQAIEDAIVLARAIESADNPATAFEWYQQHRHARTKTFVDGSLRFGRVAQGGNPFWRMIRNHIVPRLPESLTRKMLDEQFMVQSHLRAQLG